MNKRLLFFIILLIVSCCGSLAQTIPAMSKATIPKEKTAFQTSSPWMPQIDVRSDIAIVYGAGNRPGMTFEQRVKSWRDKGYQTDFMTGIAWDLMTIISWANGMEKTIWVMDRYSAMAIPYGMAIIFLMWYRWPPLSSI